MPADVVQGMDRAVVAPQDDTIDSYMYWYVPSDLPVAASDITTLNGKLLPALQRIQQPVGIGQVEA
jgi:hypothetical protein